MASASIYALMHRDSDTLTISLDRPRHAILYTLYFTACVVLAIVIAFVPLLVLSRYG
jgi:hypothetical protein